MALEQGQAAEGPGSTRKRESLSFEGMGRRVC